MRVVVILLSIISCQSTTETIFTASSTTTTPPHFLSHHQHQQYQGTLAEEPAAAEPRTNTNNNNDARESNNHNSNNNNNNSSNSESSSNFYPATSPEVSNSRSRVIETKYGKLQGLSITLFPNLNNQQHQNQQKSSNGGNNNNNNAHSPIKNKIVEVFLGIPYASPPPRFSPTRTPIPWEGIKYVDKPGHVCPQMMPDIRHDGIALGEMPKGYLNYLKHVEPFLRNQSEDCLYLNIYSPIGPEPKLKPVFVFIHGGKFVWGSGSIVDGTVFSAYGDVLFVSLNYRLGVLGFLNTNPSPLTKPRVANYGLMDQIAALHWIKENIIYFGGDPENVTLMGYEAGAASIHFLMSSPAVIPGLFHRSILIAGSSFAPWAFVSDPASVANNLAATLNCSHNSTTTTTGNSMNVSFSTHFSSSSQTSSSLSANETVYFLPIPQQYISQSSFTSSSSSSKSSSSYGQTTNSDPIIECLKSKHFLQFSQLTTHKFSTDWGPSIDGVVIKPHYRIPAESQMGKRDVMKKYDLLFGLSSLEKIIEFSEADMTFGFEAARRDAILRTLVRNSYRFHLNEILATIINEYTDWERSPQHPTPTRDLTVNAVTDCLSLAPVIAAAESSHINKAFFYVFDYSTKDGLFNYQRTGAAGGEELSYIFGYPLVEIVTGQVLNFVPPPLPSNYTKNEMALSELLITYFSNFAHTSDPNEPVKAEITWPLSKERNRFRTTPWELYDRVQQKYLEISATKLKTKSHYRAHQMAIWLRLVPELQRSGAHYASSLHNRMKGGNDPALYVGSVRNRGGTSTEEMNPQQQLFDLGFGESSSANGSEDSDSLNNPPSPPTTCFSPVLSAKNSSSGSSSSSSSSSVGLSSKDRQNDTTAFDVSNLFSPYSTALSVTIGVGCSFLILNVFVFALVYYQRDKRRAQLLKESQNVTDAATNGEQQHHHQSSKYGEPPELLKSNSAGTDVSNVTTVGIGTGGCGGGTGTGLGGGSSSVVGTPFHKSNSVCSQTTTHLDSCSLHSHPASASASSTQLQHHRGILLSPSQVHAHSNHFQQQHQQQQQQFPHHHHQMFSPQGMLGSIATLPRSNGGFEISSLKPPPPPRSISNFSTLQHKQQQQQQHNIPSSNSSSKLATFEELNV